MKPEIASGKEQERPRNDGDEMYIKNRPALSRRAIWFRLFYSSTSKASPNDFGIVIIVIIIGKLDAGVHRGADYSTEYLQSSVRFEIWRFTCFA